MIPAQFAKQKNNFNSNVVSTRTTITSLGNSIKEGEKDLRELLYWHPILQVDKSLRIPFTAPSYPGRFKVVAEGMDEAGKPVRCVESFEVR